MVDPDRLQSAYLRARTDLIDRVSTEGPWIGRTSSSPLATAAAISSLVLTEPYGRQSDDQLRLGGVYRTEFDELIHGGLHWLAAHQNTDGGWGDTDRSLSNVISTTCVVAAFHLTGVPACYVGLLERAEAYLCRCGGIRAVRRAAGIDPYRAAMVLAHAALAGLLPWREVPLLWFEKAGLPPPWDRWWPLPLASYAVPAIVATGLARWHHAGAGGRRLGLLRGWAEERSLSVLARMQPPSGGYFETVPLTGFVVMSLASFGRANHMICRRGVEFLLESVRADGSWPVDVDRSVDNTALALRALGSGRQESSSDQIVESSGRREVGSDNEAHVQQALNWLVSRQRLEQSARSGGVAGGWAWTDRPGGVPDTGDTAAVLEALAIWRDRLVVWGGDEQVQPLITLAIEWLLAAQGTDGGWRALPRRAGHLPTDRSAADLTARALRALGAWRDQLQSDGSASWRQKPTPGARGGLAARVDRAIEDGVRFLQDSQQGDGSWPALWFGDPVDPRGTNAVVGTAQVLMALGELGLADTPPARRGIAWLCGSQQVSGGWGSGGEAAERGRPGAQVTVEETSMAIEALLAAGDGRAVETAIETAIGWLVQAVESGRHLEGASIGISYSRWWYHDAIYPLAAAVSALGSLAARRLQPRVLGRAAASSPR